MTALLARLPKRQTLAFVVVVTLLIAGLLATGDDRADAVDGPVDVVYVAQGEVFADALAGSVIAATNNAPLLLVSGTNFANAIPTDTAAELTRLQPARIIVLGGSAAVSDTVLDQLRGFATDDDADEVERLFGANRFATAVDIAQALPSAVKEAVHAQEADNADTLDGKDSTEFLGATDKAADSDLLDGKDSTEFLGATDTAADSDLLDGKDSTAFEQFGGTIPSGTTLTGNWYAAPSNGSAGGSFGFFEMTFPTTASAPVNIVSSNSNMGDGTANGTDNDSTCTGTAGDPTAPAGTVCWYVGFQTGLTELRAFGSNGDQARGAAVRVTGNGTSTNQYARGSWAYTAP